MKRTILVVDDEQLNRQIIINALSESEQDYTVLSAVDGEMGCMLAEKMNPDLILLDWKMPVLTGYDALLRLKSQEKTKHIPVVMITGVTNDKDIQSCYEIGMKDYIAKPVKKQGLLEKVGSILSETK